MSTSAKLRTPSEALSFGMKQLRLRCGVTQEEMALLIGVSWSKYRERERGRSNGIPVDLVDGLRKLVGFDFFSYCSCKYMFDTSLPSDVQVACQMLVESFEPMLNEKIKAIRFSPNTKKQNLPASGNFKGSSESCRVINPDLMYQKSEILRVMSWGQDAWNQARRDGLKVHFANNNSPWVLGKDMIAFLQGQPTVLRGALNGRANNN